MTRFGYDRFDRPVVRLIWKPRREVQARCWGALIVAWIWFACWIFAAVQM